MTDRQTARLTDRLGHKGSFTANNTSTEIRLKKNSPTITKYSAFFSRRQMSSCGLSEGASEERQAESSLIFQIYGIAATYAYI